LDERLDGPQGRSGHCGEEKNSQLLPGLESPIIQPVAQRYNTDIVDKTIQFRIFYLSVSSLKTSRLKCGGTLILPVFLYGCETWSLTLREGHGV
jgi:hypothetical protein